MFFKRNDGVVRSRRFKKNLVRYYATTENLPKVTSPIKDKNKLRGVRVSKFQHLANLAKNVPGAGLTLKKKISSESVTLRRRGGRPLVHFYDFGETVRKKTHNSRVETPNRLF